MTAPSEGSVNVPTFAPAAHWNTLESSPHANPFQQLWSKGYRDLIPVIPPSAAEQGIRSAGKRPGVLIDGRWSGRSRADFRATEKDLDIWAAWGAGVGLRCDNAVIGVDIDTTTPRWSRLIQQIAADTLGILPRRIGQAPKTLLMGRCDGADYRQIRFDDGSPPVTMRSGKTRPGVGLVELLAGPHHYFNVLATHPKTGRAYALPDGLPHFDALPRVTAEQLDAFFLRLAEELPKAAEANSSSIDRSTVDQSSLKGRDLDVLEEAIAWLPNDPARTGYDEWVRMAAAFRGAFQDDYGRGLALFEDWSDKADIAEPTESAARVCGSINPPFAIGADYIEAAAERGGWPGRVERWLDDPAEQPQPLPGSAGAGEARGATSVIRPVPYSFRDPSSIPVRQVLYGGHYVRQFVSTTVAPTKVGKSSLIVTEALAMASGRPLLGITPLRPLRVWLWNGEDPLEELERHVAATMMHYGLSRADMCDEDGASRLMLGSGREMEIVLAVTGRDGAKISAPVVDAVTAAIQTHAIDVLTIDPFVSSHRVSENDNGSIDMVAKQWGAIAGRTGAAIELVHHVRKLNGAAATIEDGRGAVALISAARSARALAKMSADEGRKLGLAEGSHRRFFRVSDAAANLGLAADNGGEWFKLESVALGNGAGDGIERMLAGDSMGVVVRADFVHESPTVELDDRSRALELVAAGEWRRDIRTRDAWVGHPIGEALHLDATDAVDQGRIKAVIKAWLDDGTLETETRRDSRSVQRQFVIVGARAVYAKAPVLRRQIDADVFG